MYKLMTTSLILILGLQACGGSDKKSIIKEKVKTFTAVHGIQPDKVADYIDKFTLDKSQLRFEFDNQSSDMFFVDNDSENKQLIVKYDNGLAFIGFDMNEDKALEKLTLAEGDTSDLANFTVTRQLEGVEMSKANRASQVTAL